MGNKDASKNKSVPLRTCIICRDKMDKRVLTRIVHSTDNGVIIDSSGKADGRGAYLCNKPACWNKAIQYKRLESSLKIELSAQDKSAILAYMSTVQ